MGHWAEVGYRNFLPKCLRCALKKEDESIYSDKGSDQKAILQFSDCKEGHEGDTKTWICLKLWISFSSSSTAGLLASCLTSLIQKTCLCSTGTSSSSLPCVLKIAREAKSSYLPTTVLYSLIYIFMVCWSHGGALTKPRTTLSQWNRETWMRDVNAKVGLFSYHVLCQKCVKRHDCIVNLWMHATFQKIWSIGMLQLMHFSII